MHLRLYEQPRCLEHIIEHLQVGRRSWRYTSTNRYSSGETRTEYRGVVALGTGRQGVVLAHEFTRPDGGRRYEAKWIPSGAEDYREGRKPPPELPACTPRLARDIFRAADAAVRRGLNGAR